MNIKPALGNMSVAAATVGTLVLVLNSIYYIYSLIHWGASNEWNYASVSGWGFRFLFHFALGLLGLLLFFPLWLSKKTGLRVPETPRKYLRWGASIGLLLLVFAITLELLLPKMFP